MKEIESQLRTWLKEICPYPVDVENYFVLFLDKRQVDNEKWNVYFYTHNYRYHLVATSNGYFGCTAQCRKSVAGEDWFRGSDLADGPFSLETWERIKKDIIKHELVKVSKRAIIKNDIVSDNPIKDGT